MSQQACDVFDDEGELKEMLEIARMNAENDWEENFVAGLLEKHKQYGARMYLSDLQLEHLNRIAGE